MSQDPERRPRKDTPEAALARTRKKTDDLGAKIDAVEKEIVPERPQTPGIGGMVGD